MTTLTEPGHLETVQVHFDDLDALGVVHNARYVLLLERALSAFWTERGWTFDPGAADFGDSFFVVREFSITYHAPITRPGTAAVRMWVEHLGSSSVVYGFAITSADGAVLHANGRRVQVKVDPATLRPSPITGRAREIVSQLLRSVA
ncbi:acyl-CoA thioesterase [Streptacidiphilus sp. N1-3]|uniref:Acyl-CoA thioesterase n=1 Tax=Streptacidiphilus alkalitolerans TaxID=3342712 RepID=A0ABV6WVQ1_9ACTN